MKVCTIKQISNTLFLIITNDSSIHYLFKIHYFFNQFHIDEINSTYKLISDNNFSPLIIPNIKGLYVSFYKDFVFSLQIFVEGKPFSSKCINLFAKRLADLHNLLNTYSNISVKNHFEKTVTDINEYASFYGYKNMLPIIDKVMTITKKKPKQLIHGDLHKDNIICYNNNIIFIDFDSMTIFSTIADVAFAGFRCFGLKKKYLYKFVDLYNQYNPPYKIEINYLWHFLVYMILQRILFIVIENDKGNKIWMTDLDNQKYYLSIILKQLNYT